MVGIRCIIFALTLIVCIYNAESLRCHLCYGSLDSDCKHGDASNFLEQDCTSIQAKEKWNLSPDVEYEAYCVAFHSKESLDVSEGFVRGCGYVYKDFDMCRYLQTNDLATEDCKDCRDDLCNA